MPWSPQDWTMQMQYTLWLAFYTNKKIAKVAELGGRVSNTYEKTCSLFPRMQF